MKVKELIDILKSLPQEANVVTERPDGNGCDTCGLGETSTEYDVTSVTDLETRVVIRID